MSKTTTEKPGLVAKSGITYTIYTLPRLFKKNAPLHSFLASKVPKEIQLERRDYTLYQVLFALRQVISKEKMFDPNNTTVVICSPLLEQAIDRKSLHVTQFRDLVLDQLETKEDYLGVEITPPQPQHPIAGAGSSQPFDTEGHYWLKPLFLKTLRSIKDKVNESGTIIKGPPPNKFIFSYRETTTYLSQYILENQNQFFDGRNIKVAHVAGSLLGKAFGLSVFHRSQVTALLRKQLIPYKPQQQCMILENDNVNSNRLNFQTSNQQTPVTAIPNTNTSETPDVSDTESDFDVYEVYDEYEPEEYSSDEKLFKNEYTTDTSDLNEDSKIPTPIPYEQQTDNQSPNHEMNNSSEDNTDTFDDIHSKILKVWKCRTCSQPTQTYIQYCTTCYKKRKEELPERPNPRKRKHNNSNHNKDVPKRTPTSRANPTPHSRDNTYTKHAPDLHPDKSSLCSLCLNKPKDACLIHGRISHMVSCYQCARKLHKQKKPCPICRRRIEKITRNIIA